MCNHNQESDNRDRDRIHNRQNHNRIDNTLRPQNHDRIEQLQMNIQNNNRQFRIGTKISNIINRRQREGTIISFNNNRYKIYYKEDKYHEELSQDGAARCINGESSSSIVWFKQL